MMVKAGTRDGMTPSLFVYRRKVTKPKDQSDGFAYNNHKLFMDIIESNDLYYHICLMPAMTVN